MYRSMLSPRGINAVYITISDISDTCVTNMTTMCHIHTSDMTTASLIGSIGGLVTYGKNHITLLLISYNIIGLHQQWTQEADCKAEG